MSEYTVIAKGDTLNHVCNGIGLPFSCDNNSLNDHFASCGEITDAHVRLFH